MNVWRVLPSDRDEEGKIKIGRSLADLLPTSGDTAQPATPRRWDQTAAVFFCGLLIGVVLVLLLGRAAPSPAAPRAPLAPPTAAPTATTAPSATIAPTATPQPTATEEPTNAPIFAPPATPTPCDPASAPYQVHRLVAPIGSVIGASCVSATEAEQHADDLAASMIATATASAQPGH